MAESSESPHARRRPRNARGEGEKLRVEILEAMLRLIADEERMRPMPLSLREVAREAGITAPAIYRHFADKEELSRAAFRSLFEQLLEEMDRAEKGSVSESPDVRLAALAHAYCNFAESNPSSFRVMFTGAEYHGEETEALAVRWRTAVARLAESGLRVTQSPEGAAMSVWSSVHGRLLLERGGGRVWQQLGDVHQFVDELVRSLATVDEAAERRDDTP
ncbi:TetR/AcrR family transcriptional regulator [Streptomyces sulphureus]|uniref:TetR/AcrR family transcriptional regulator n=1 Tax=Streptomyces sulphureus TaxID=47758 RepID=UPI0003806D41|nr:TetR/AcrR family transcriptional regulator [Streptomyces sulphureus]